MRARAAAPWLLGVVVAVVVLGPALAPGYVLIGDMVFVPDWPLGLDLVGVGAALPRAVPSDLVVALASRLLPGDVVQSAVLVGALAGAVAGVVRLVPQDVPWPARAAGAVYYGWNAWVFERLLLGHWPFLVAYAALPWALAWAVRARRESSVAGVPGGVVVAGLTGGAGLALVVPTSLLTLLWPRPAPPTSRRWWSGGLLLVTALLVAVPWLVPTLLREGGVPVRPSGFEVFAARADTPLGTLGSVFTLGGAWNALAAPVVRTQPLPAALALVLAVLSVLGLVVLVRRGDAVMAAPLAVAGGGSLLLVAFLATPVGAGLAASGAELLPWLGVLRDSQKFLAPLALAQAVGLAGLLGAVLARAQRGVVWAPAVVVVVSLLPLVALPALAGGAGGKLVPVRYPAAWFEAREVMAADPVAGDVLVLPWTLYQRLPFNPDAVVLAPAQRFLPREAVVSDDLVVGDRVVAGESRAAARADPLVRSGSALAQGVGELGIRYVFVARPGGASQQQLAGLDPVVRSATTELWRVPVALLDEPERARPRTLIPVLIADVLAVVALTVLAARTRRRRPAGL